MSNCSKKLDDSHSLLNLKRIAIRNPDTDVNFQNSIPNHETIQFLSLYLSENTFLCFWVFLLLKFFIENYSNDFFKNSGKIIFFTKPDRIGKELEWVIGNMIESFQ